MVLRGHPQIKLWRSISALFHHCRYPPLSHDSGTYHRIIAAEELGLAEIAADVRDGTRRDAILYAVGANAAAWAEAVDRDKRNAAAAERSGVVGQQDCRPVCGYSAVCEQTQGVTYNCYK